MDLPSFLPYLKTSLLFSKSSSEGNESFVINLLWFHGNRWIIPGQFLAFWVPGKTTKSQAVFLDHRHGDGCDITRTRCSDLCCHLVLDEGALGIRLDAGDEVPLVDALHDRVLKLIKVFRLFPILHLCQSGLTLLSSQLNDPFFWHAFVRNY